jgi:uncharacterized membrane protein YfcA
MPACFDLAQVWPPASCSTFDASPVITDPAFYLVAVPAMVALGLAKGGFTGVGLLAVPLLSLYVSPLQAVGIMLPILMVQDALTFWSFRHSWDKRVLAIMIPGQLIGTLLAWLLAAYVSDSYVRVAVGLIAIAFTLNHWFGRVPPPRQGPPSIPGGLLAGAAAGGTSFLASAGSPPFQVYVLPLRLPRDVFVGTITAFFGLGNYMKIGPYYALGSLTIENLLTSLALLPLAVLTNVAGMWIVRRTPNELFYKIAYVLVFLIGLELIRNGLSAILTAK